MNWQRAFFCIALNHLSTRLQLDSVIVDETVNIYSRGDVLIQNCVGFGSAATKNATVGACEDTSSYCLSDSCADATVGIECKCMFKGEEVLFPTDCMQVGYAEQSFEFSDKSLNASPSTRRQSAVIKVPVPSTQTLTYLIQKPDNETAELMLANVRLSA